MVRRIAALTAVLGLSLALAGSAHAGGLYYPKRAYFEMRVSGTQTTTVRADALCRDAATGEDVRRFGELTETVRFSTRRPGVVLFKTDGSGGLDLFQENDDFEDGVRPVLARGTVERQSTLTPNGSSISGCHSQPAAEGCGSATFDSWRLHLFGRGRKVAVGLGSSGLAGGDPLSRCDHPDAFPETFRNRPVRLGRSAPFRKRRFTLADEQTRTTRYYDRYDDRGHTLTRSIEWKATLVRKGPVTRGGQPIR